MATLRDVTLTLEWESAAPAGVVRHRDSLFAGGVDLLRDTLPGTVADSLMAAGPGQTVTLPIAASDPPGAGAVFDMPVSGLQHPQAVGGEGVLRYGLYYPSTLFALPPAHQTPRTVPVRYLGTESGMMRLDIRHPLSDYAVTLSATVLRAFDGQSDDRPATDWAYRLLAGPGLQACWRGTETVYLFDGAYGRPDDSADQDFYEQARITAHIDQRAQRTVGDYYAGIIPPDGCIFDLMSSAHSNLHPEQRFGSLTGLGMNAAEMRANAGLTDSVVADLNAGAPLPFADDSFDAAICTVSIDYLTDPVRVMREVGRVLRPGAGFAVTFSNRWFPPKVTRLWTELTSFEQLGLVTQYFQHAGCFDTPATASFRGLPRPPDDPYIGHTDESDPVFGVVGYARH